MDRVKKDVGVFLCIIFTILFLLISNMLVPYFDGAYWYCVSSFQRILFFALELFIFVKLFRKEKVSEIIHFHNFKSGLAAGLIMFIYVPFYLITYCVIGAKSWINTTVPIVVSCLFLQQLVTGLWEELTFRAFVCEGYYQGSDKTSKNRVIYALISSLVFGICHAIECDTWEIAIYRFITTAIWGFAFASIYLYSHNILVTMFMHFFTDVFLNINNFIEDWNDSTALTILDNYISFVLLGIMFIVALYYLIRTPKTES